jgi:microcompartment protein CcmL/EutN
MGDALGLIETRGLVVPLIEAADAMVKAANVEILVKLDQGRRRVGQRGGARRRRRCAGSG